MERVSRFESLGWLGLSKAAARKREPPHSWRQRRGAELSEERAYNSPYHSKSSDDLPIGRHLWLVARP